jgi:homoserine kinase type II
VDLSAERVELLMDELYSQAVFACARFSTTRITDFELRPRGTGVHKDFRRWLRRLDTVERLGEVGLCTILHARRFAKEPRGD